MDRKMCICQIVSLTLIAAMVGSCSIDAAGTSAEITSVPKTAVPTFSAMPPASTATHEPTETPLPVPTISLTDASPAPTPTLVLTDGRIFQFNDFFFNSNVSLACVLPCWRGLIVGQSGPQDVQNVLDDVFGFNHTVNFFADPLADNTNLGILRADTSRIPESYGIWHRWDIGGTNFQNFVFAAGFERHSNRLQIVGFHWETTDTTKFEVIMSPQTVIKELGEPSYMLAGVEGLIGGRAITSFTLIYDQGMAFEFINETHESIVWADSDHTAMKEVTTEFCLGNTKTTNGVGRIGPYVYILPPFTRDLDELVPIQSATIGAEIDAGRIGPIEEIFDTTQDEITLMALNEENPCLRTKNLIGR